MLHFGWGRGLRNIVEPLNAVVLAIIPEKRPSSADPLARRYACDSSPDEGAATGENVDAARPGCFAVSTAGCTARSAAQPRGSSRHRLSKPSVFPPSRLICRSVMQNKSNWFIHR